MLFRSEWEFACRAGTSTPFPNGTADESTLPGLAWFAPNADGRTHPVGTRDANALGFADMLGNVSEWVMDPLADYVADNGSTLTGPLLSPLRGIRGGSWYDDAGGGGARSSARSGGGTDRSDPGIGFRAARSP